jgi:hypothetical protein
MHRVPLSTPAHAAALVAVGFPRQGIKLDPLHHTGTGERKMGWFYEGADAMDAADLLKRRRADLHNALWRSDKAHPFLAALAGVQNLEVLAGWREKPQAVPSGTLAHGKALLLLMPAAPAETQIQAALLSLPPLASIYETATPQGCAAVEDLAVAAALVAVGFPPAPVLLTGGRFAIRQNSFLHPHLAYQTAVEAMRVMRNPLQFAPARLENFKAGQHPLQFAYAAAGNYLTVPDCERRAWAHATHFIKGHRCALVNKEALQNPALEQKIMEHVAGV